MSSFPKTEAHLLVVDDEESLRITTAAILDKEGYVVDTAASGDEAISLLTKIDYDLVLTDLHMEGGDGLTVLSQIRRQAPLTISVVLTGFASVESAIAALQEGAYDYLIKPCDIDNMKHTIKRGVEHRRLMLAEQKARTDLEKLNRELEQRIEQRTAELQKVNEQLAAANRAKDIFLATLSHELRTPLTPVVGWIKLLRGGSLDSKGVMQALDAIERNAWLQSRLIDDLLDTSRIATGKLHFEPVRTDLNCAVNAATDTVRAAAAAKNIELVNDLSELGLPVMGEPVRLQQIAWNLISNAIKFTKQNGKVTIKTEREGNVARFSVTDNGIGIDKDFLPHVFDRFRQADGSTSRIHGGLGLGLAIAHALAVMHGGVIEAASEGPGRGAEFTFSLKLAEGLDPLVMPREAPVHSFKDLRVLIVEDSSDTLTLLKALFSREGAQVLTATSAQEAIDAVLANQVDLIISDIGMPEVDGFTFLKQLRSSPNLQNLPAIAISGYASDEDRARAVSVGYVTLVAKPIDIDELFSVIRQLNLTASPVDSSQSQLSGSF